MQFGNGLICKTCKGQSGVFAHICGNDSRSASIGNNGDPVTCGDFLCGKGLGIIKEFVDRMAADNSGLGKNGVIDGIRTCKGKSSWRFFSRS